MTTQIPASLLGDCRQAIAEAKELVEGRGQWLIEQASSLEQWLLDLVYACCEIHSVQNKVNRALCGLEAALEQARDGYCDDSKAEIMRRLRNWLVDVMQATDELEEARAAYINTVRRCKTKATCRAA